MDAKRIVLAIAVALFPAHAAHAARLQYTADFRVERNDNLFLEIEDPRHATVLRPGVDFFEGALLGIPAIAVFPVVEADRKTEDGRHAVDPDNLACRTVEMDLHGNSLSSRCRQYGATGRD